MVSSGQAMAVSWMKFTLGAALPSEPRWVAQAGVCPETTAVGKVSPWRPLVEKNGRNLVAISGITWVLWACYYKFWFWLRWATSFKSILMLQLVILAHPNVYKFLLDYCKKFSETSRPSHPFIFLLLSTSCNFLIVSRVLWLSELFLYGCSIYTLLFLFLTR